MLQCLQNIISNSSSLLWPKLVIQVEMAWDDAALNITVNPMEVASSECFSYIPKYFVMGSCGGWLISMISYVNTDIDDGYWYWSEYLISKESGSCGGGAQSSEKGLQESDVGDDSSDEELYEVWAWAWATSLSCFAERICLVLHICGFFVQRLWNTPKFYRNHATPKQSCLVVPLYHYTNIISFCCISKYIFAVSLNIFLNHLRIFRLNQVMRKMRRTRRPPGAYSSFLLLFHLWQKQILLRQKNQPFSLS